MIILVLVPGREGPRCCDDTVSRRTGVPDTRTRVRARAYARARAHARMRVPPCMLKGMFRSP